MNFILFVSIILAGTSYASFTARNVVDNSYEQNWAANLCSSAHQLCQHPHETAYAAGGYAALWLLMKFVSAIKN